MRRLNLTEEERKERRRQEARAYRAKNRDAVNARARARYAKNIEKEHERRVRYRRENKAHYHELDKASRKRNAAKRREWAEKHKDYYRKYYRKNKAILLEKNKDYRRRNHEKVLAIYRKYYESHREKYVEYRRRFRVKHPEYYKEWKIKHQGEIGKNYRKRRGKDKVRARERQRAYALKRSLIHAVDAKAYAEFRCKRRVQLARRLIKKGKMYHARVAKRIPDYCCKGEVDDFIQSPEPLKYGAWEAVHRGHKWTRDGR